MRDMNSYERPLIELPGCCYAKEAVTHTVHARGDPTCHRHCVSPLVGLHSPIRYMVGLSAAGLNADGESALPFAGFSPPLIALQPFIHGSKRRGSPESNGRRGLTDDDTVWSWVQPWLTE